jgi:hypothetical protein
VVSTLPRLLDSLEDACLPHGLEEVDDAGAADGVGLELGVDSVPYGFGAEALGVASELATSDDPSLVVGHGSVAQPLMNIQSGTYLARCAYILSKILHNA